MGQGFHDSFEPIIEIVEIIAEVAIDSILDESLLKEIPVVSSIFKAIEFSNSISKRAFEKKMIKFLMTFKDSNTISYKDIESKYVNVEKFKEQINETIFFVINNSRDELIAEFNGFLTRGIFDKSLTWDEYIFFTTVTNQLFKIDIEVLNFLFKNRLVSNIDEAYQCECVGGFAANKLKIPYSENMIFCSLKRLSQFGFVYPFKVNTEIFVIDSEEALSYKLNVIGEKWCNSCLENIDLEKYFV